MDAIKNFLYPRLISRMSLCVMMLINFGCGSSENNAKNHSPNTQAESTINEDTLNVSPPHTEPPLSPGTAKVTAQFLGISKNPSIMKIRVISVDGYGSSTPAIATDSDLRIYVPHFLTDEVQKLNKNKKIVCLLNYRQFLHTDNNIIWVLGEVSSFSDPQ